MLRRMALAAAVLLGVFHAWLLGAQAWSGHLAQPDVVLRWVAGVVLVGGLAALGRRGAPVVFGRQAVAIWVLAALLHGPAIANDLDGFATPMLPEAVTSVVRVAGTLAAAGLALLLVFRHAVGAIGVAAGLLGLRAQRVLPAFAPARQLRFLPRPPPVV